WWARLARGVADKRVLKLIRRYVAAGVMVEGVKQPTEEGTPQGSPLSPLLANIMLDDLDRELERRGHHFVRYADDIRIHVKSERAGQRVLAGVREWISKRVKRGGSKEKPSVKQAIEAVLVGFGFYLGPGGKVGIRVSPNARVRLRWRMRKLTARHWRIAMPERIERLNRYIGGWGAFFWGARRAGSLKKTGGAVAPPPPPVVVLGREGRG